MSSFSGADLFIGGVFEMTSGVSDSGRDYALYLSKSMFDSPEASSGKSGFVCFLRFCVFLGIGHILPFGIFRTGNYQSSN